MSEYYFRFFSRLSDADVQDRYAEALLNVLIDNVPLSLSFFILGQARDGQSSLLHRSQQHHVGRDAGSEQMAFARRDRGLGDAYDRPRTHCLSRNGPRAHARLHSGRIDRDVARSRAFCASNSTRRCRNWRRWECACSEFRVSDERRAIESRGNRARDRHADDRED